MATSYEPWSESEGKCAKYSLQRRHEDADPMHLVRIHFSICCGVIFIATFIPRGAFSFNPDVIGDIKLEGDPSEESVNREASNNNIHNQPNPIAQLLLFN